MKKKEKTQNEWLEEMLDVGHREARDFRERILAGIEDCKKRKIERIDELTDLLAGESSGGNAKYADWLRLRLEASIGELNGLREAQSVIDFESAGEWR